VTLRKQERLSEESGSIERPSRLNPEHLSLRISVLPHHEGRLRGTIKAYEAALRLTLPSFQLMLSLAFNCAAMQTVDQLVRRVNK